MRLRERLVQVDVDDVEPHVARARDTADRVQVRAVVVHERAGAVEDRLDLLDVLVEEAERGRVGDHQPGGLRPDLRAHVVDIDVAALVRLHADEVIAGHRHRGRVRAVRRVGDDDLAALLVLASVGEVGVEEHQARELPLGTGGGLERDGVEPADLGEDLLQAPHELERALRALLLLERVQVAEPGQADEALVHARVVLHRARAERVEAGVDSEVSGRELGEVPDELGLGDLRQPRRRRPRELRRHLRHRQVVARERRGAAARLGALVDQRRHALSASTSRSTSAGVRFSVTATSSASSMPS
jgi:hypothetical protein